MGEEPTYDQWEDPEWLTSYDIDDGRFFDDRWNRMLQAEPAKSEKLRNILEKIVSSLEGLAKPDAKKALDAFRKYPELWEWMVDWYYSRESVLRIPDLKRRFEQFVLVIAGKTPNTEVKVYLREATRCYLYGFFQATVALSRASLETGLNDHLKRRLGSVPDLRLGQKIDQLTRWKLLSPASADLAHRVQRDANGVLHDHPISEKVAFERLKDVRTVLLELYKA